MFDISFSRLNDAASLPASLLLCCVPSEGDPPRQRKLTLEQTASCLDNAEETNGRLTKRRVQRKLQLYLC